MGKNSPGHSWWRYTGSDKGIRKITNTLTYKRHYVVLDTKTRVYLNIQGSEEKFVKGLASTHQCQVDPVDEPAWQETLCGKRTMSRDRHQRRCNGCNRQKGNQARQRSDKGLPRGGALSTTYANFDAPPDILDVTIPQVMPSTDPRSGPVVVVAPAQNDPIGDEFIGLATLNDPPVDYATQIAICRRIADVLMAKAEYYLKVVDSYEAIQQSQNALDVLLTDGPPE